MMLPLSGHLIMWGFALLGDRIVVMRLDLPGIIFRWALIEPAMEFAKTPYFKGILSSKFDLRAKILQHSGLLQTVKNASLKTFFPKYYPNICGK